MQNRIPQGLRRGVDRTSTPLHDPDGLDRLLDLVGDSRYVLLGEASHGTSEFYTWRMNISKRLIDEKGFSFIAVEGDWPDCYRLNRYVKAYEHAGESARDVLHAFDRWPTWMWANWEVVALGEWLLEHNKHLSDGEPQVGFFGLDVYSLWESMEAIIEYLEEHDPDAVEAARRAFMCFEPFGEDVQEYAWSTTMVPDTCEDEVIELLQEIREHAEHFPGDEESKFSTEQNAHVMVGAEKYYRAMVRSDQNSWNVRDHHMVDTLDRLMDFHGPDAKAIVWEHNTHIGDARYTDMSRAGMVNVGQLVRERHSDEGVVLVGFGSHRGTVIAGNEWGAPMERMEMPRGIGGSWEDVLHQVGDGEDQLLILPGARENDEMLRARGHRAIGVVYHPAWERGNYVPTVLPHRYDALVFIDESEALHPLHLQPEGEKPPELFPWGV